jgi:hypothetical protein
MRGKFDSIRNPEIAPKTGYFLFDDNPPRMRVSLKDVNWSRRNDRRNDASCVRDTLAAAIGGRRLDSEKKQVSGWRRGLAIFGYAALCLSIVLHFALWVRVAQLHGLWGHFSEAFRWFQAIDLTSLLAFILCLFGIGWRRWVGSTLGLLSFLLCCGYAVGL